MLRAAIAAAMAKGPRAGPEQLAPLRAAPLLELVQAMQPELTSQEPKTAPIAIHVLGHAAIERTAPIEADAMRVLMAFFASKVNHFTTIDAAIEACARVFVWWAEHGPAAVLSAGVLTEVVCHSLARVQVQSMFGASKTMAFALLRALLTDEATAAFENDHTRAFLSAFLAAVDGERDPEMVLESFRMTQRVVSLFPAQHLTFFLEDLFANASNYFPVLFTPPPGCRVTKGELREALEGLLAQPVFHEHCIPFAAAKLASPAAVAKSDAVDLLRRTLRPGQYPVALLEPHLMDLLTAVRAEVVKLAQMAAVNPASAALLEQVLGLARDVGAVLGPMPADAQLAFADPVLSAAQSIVETGSNARPYAMLLNSLARGSPATAHAVAAHALPTMAAKIASLNMLTAGPQERRGLEAATAVVGGLLSALETLKNGGGNASEVTPVALPPSTAAAIVAPLYQVVSGESAAVLEAAAPLAVEVLLTFVAVRALLPPVPVPSEAIVLAVLRRGCNALVPTDEAQVCLRGLGNLARVEAAAVATAAMGPAGRDVLRLSARLPTFFAAIADATGPTAAVANAAIDALLLLPDALLVAALEAGPAHADAVLRAATTFVPFADEAAAQRVIERLAAVPLAVRTADGVSAMRSALGRCAEARAAVLGGGPDADTATWLCAVSAATAADMSRMAAGDWMARSVAAAEGNGELRPLALQAVCAVANTAALPESLTEQLRGADAEVCGAVAKGLCARGEDPATALGPLLAIFTTSPTDRSAEVFADIFGPPPPTVQVPMWPQRTLAALVGAVAAGPPTLWRAVAEGLRTAPARAVAAAAEAVPDLATEPVRACLASALALAVLVQRAPDLPESLVTRAAAALVATFPQLLDAPAASLPLRWREIVVVGIANIATAASASGDTALIGRTTARKGAVLAWLQAAVDDRKRRVRAGAAAARQAWFMLK